MARKSLFRTGGTLDLCVRVWYIIDKGYNGTARRNCRRAGSGGARNICPAYDSRRGANRPLNGMRIYTCIGRKTRAHILYNCILISPNYQKYKFFDLLICEKRAKLLVFCRRFVIE